MATIKNEYNYSTSVKSNLLFNEESELQEKKKIFVPFLQYRLISPGRLVNWVLFSLSCMTPKVPMNYLRCPEQRKEIFSEICTHTYVYIYLHNIVTI